MTPEMSFYVTMEFKVLRRIAWEGEREALRDHLDAVCDHLDASAEVVEWKLVGDLEEQTLSLEMVVDAATPSAAEAGARAVAGEAIRNAGALHEGLLSLREESEARINANAWYGLRTPRWQPRRIELAEL
jgi:hypothetical protein